MGELYNRLASDIRFVESLTSCINCGTCTAICPAAEFYNYDPRVIATTVQTRDDEKIRELMSSDTIWYCGECMSCKTRCPRGNAPGLLVMALRSMSQDMGFFAESEKGRQQLAVKRIIGDQILSSGYCVRPDMVAPGLHPEQGPVWEWEFENLAPIMDKLGANYNGDGPGALRKVPDSDLEELRKIFEITGGKDRYDKIEAYSKEKADEMGLEIGTDTSSEYVQHVYTTNNQKHNHE
ncbi:MAG: 4Fe-4S dicluster domain-containing protein [Bacteroidota bacterium]